MFNINKLTIMKRLSLFVLCLLTVSLTVLGQDYYWYKGNKIQITRGSQFYIIYEDDLLADSDKAKIESGDYVFYDGYSNLKWGTTKPNAEIEDKEHIHYCMYSYKKANRPDDMFVTHRFYVKLKSVEDVSTLESLAAEKGAEIDEHDEDVPLWYVLRCKLDAPHNALELANMFYESGLFAVAEPEFMNQYEFASLELNNEESSVKNKIIRDGRVYIICDDKTYTVSGQQMK